MDPVDERLKSLLADNRFIRRWNPSRHALSDRLFSLLAATASWAEPHYQQILRLFPEYTPHDFTVHSLNLLDTLDWLLTEQVTSHLSHWDVFFVTGAAILHDIGMGPSPQAIAGIRHSTAFQQLSSRMREQTLEQIPDEALLRQYVRQNHHALSATLIRSYFRDVDRGAGEVVALIAEAHGCPVATVASDPKYSRTLAFSPGLTADVPYLSMIVRMADLFDATRHRARLRLYDFLQPMAIESDVQWRTHQATLGIARQPTRSGVITVSAVCCDPEAYHELRKHQLYVNQELRDVLAYLSTRRDVPDLDIRSIEFDIRTEGFIKKEWKFELSPSGIVRLLMGDRLYSDAIVAIRELIQNSIDAVRQMAKISPRDYQPKIEVSLDFVDNRYVLTIQDNGIGMDDHIIEEFFLRIGRPYYQSPDYRLRYDPRVRIEPIGQFGIGFISVFMLAHRVSVDTLKAGSRPVHFEMTDVMEYLVATESNRTVPGTTIRLLLKPGMAVRTTTRQRVQQPTSMDTPEEPDIASPQPEFSWRHPPSQSLWHESPLTGAWSPVLRAYRDTADPFRVRDNQRNVSVLSLEACLDVFIGYLEFPIRYKEIWEQDYTDFQRVHFQPLKGMIAIDADADTDTDLHLQRVHPQPLVGTIVIDADADTDLGLSGRIALPSFEQPRVQNIVSQNGMRIRSLETTRLLPPWLTHAAMELDLSGPARVDLLASREEVSSQSLGPLRLRIDALVRRGMKDNFNLLHHRVGASFAAVSVAWHFFPGALAYLMGASRTPFSEAPGHLNYFANWLLDYLPLLADMPDGRRVVTLSELRQTPARLRLVFTPNESAIPSDPNVVQLFVAPNPALFIALVYAFRYAPFQGFEIMDGATGLLMEDKLAVVNGSGISVLLQALESLQSPIRVPRLLYGPLLNSRAAVREISCLGGVAYLLNSNHPAMLGLEEEGTRHDLLSPLCVDRWSHMIYSAPAFVAGVDQILLALDMLSGTKETTESPHTLMDSFNTGLDNLYHRSSSEDAVRVSMEDMPSSWHLA